MPSPHHEHPRTDTFQWRAGYNTNLIFSSFAVRVVGTACISPADPLVSCPTTDMTPGCRRVGKLNFAGINVVKINASANLAFWWQARWLKLARLFCKVNRHIDFRSQNRRSRSRAIDYSEFKCSLPEHLYFFFVRHNVLKWLTCAGYILKCYVAGTAIALKTVNGRFVCLDIHTGSTTASIWTFCALVPVCQHFR